MTNKDKRAAPKGAALPLTQSLAEFCHPQMMESGKITFSPGTRTSKKRFSACQYASKASVRSRLQLFKEMPAFL